MDLYQTFLLTICTFITHIPKELFLISCAVARTQILFATFMKFYKNETKIALPPFNKNDLVYGNTQIFFLRGTKACRRFLKSSESLTLTSRMLDADTAIKSNVSAVEFFFFKYLILCNVTFGFLNYFRTSKGFLYIYFIKLYALSRL